MHDEPNTFVSFQPLLNARSEQLQMEGASVSTTQTSLIRLVYSHGTFFRTSVSSIFNL